MTIISALKDQNLCLASYGDIILDIHQLSNSFHCVKFCHVRREGNKAAHTMACKVLDLHFDFLVWLEDVQDFLENVIQAKFHQF